MTKTLFRIAKMDCPSEEQVIRMTLAPFTNIRLLEFNIPERQLAVYHTEGYHEILDALHGLHFDTSLLSSVPEENLPVSPDEGMERRLLWQVLAINFFFFLLEIAFGFISHSMGLVADSLDMLADSIVYALALFAVGGTVTRKKNIAKAAGYFQLFLALFGLVEILRRFLGFESLPDFRSMICVSAFALMGNALCLYLLQKTKSREAHLQASRIFTSNDVIVNLGVILAGVLVYLTRSPYPDLLIGASVFYLVAKGSFKILKLSA